MREYLALPNLIKALLLGGITAVMALPRIVQAGMDPVLGGVTAFTAMTMTAGMVCAWGGKAGMAGLFPAWHKALGGITVALVAGCCVSVLSLHVIDPVVKHVFSVTGNGKSLELMFSDSTKECVGLLLWGAGFEILFFEAGAMSFFARLTGSSSVSVLGAAGLKMFVVFNRLSELGITDEIPLFIISSGATSAVACILFAKSGLPAIVVFSVVLSLRHFLAG